MMELYKKHRPKKLKRVLGQEKMLKSISSLAAKDKLPHTIMMIGPSGCGKTTIARILAKLVKCGKNDLDEINCAHFRGIDTVRDIQRRMWQAPMDGDARVWIIDECHKLSNDAQNAFLKILEDTPKHVYFILCTTDPHKLLKTVRTRCTEWAVKELNDEAMNKLICKVCMKEELKISDKVIDKIIEVSDGAARKALVLLNQIAELDGTNEQIEAIEACDIEKGAIEIARALFKTSTSWKQMAQLLNGKEIDISNTEGIRYLVLAYATTILLSGRNNNRAYNIIDAFSDNFYDSKKAGLVAACFEIICPE